MRVLLGVTDGIGPEECYRHWFARIEPDYVEMVREAVEEILSSGRGEVIYPWNHPVLGKIYVRCGGVPDRTFEKPGALQNVLQALPALQVAPLFQLPEQVAPL